MNIKEVLNKIQRELKAPKSQKNIFGNYNYRNAEDILEAVKPLLDEATLTITDEIVLVGDRYYVKATVTLSDGDNNNISTSAYARESLDKKGMDSAQITGATSSYARKYALNGLFCIDDTKDSDTTNDGEKKDLPTGEAKPAGTKPTEEPEVSEAMKATLSETAKMNCWTNRDIVSAIQKTNQRKSTVLALTKKEYDKVLTMLSAPNETP